MSLPSKGTPRSVAEVERMSRNLLVTGWSQEAQDAFEKTRFLVIGCGGLASFLLPSLVAAGARQVSLYDDDRVEASNLNRQVLHQEGDLGEPKVESAARHLVQLAHAAKVTAHAERIDCSNARELVAAHDVILDCADGLPTKFLLNDAAVLEDRPLIHGAVTGLSGQVLSVPKAGRPCLRCLFPTLPARGTVQTCQTAGVLAPTVMLVASVMATEVLGLFGLLEPRDASAGLFRTIDGRSLHVDAIRLVASQTCPACGPAPEVTGEDPEDYVLSTPTMSADR